MQVAQNEQAAQGAQGATDANPQAQKRRKQKQQIKRTFIKLVCVVAAVWLVFTFVFGVHRMEGEEMYPALRDGDLLLTFRLDTNYVNTDVVVYNYQGHLDVGRVVAREGDVVSFTDDGVLLVNGNVQSEEVVYETLADETGVSVPYTVPAGCYFMLGDFRTYSVDSRSYGAISASDIQGKVIGVFRHREI